NYGADAVYGGVSHFSLRIRSGKEFTYESFKEAIDYTHEQNKKLYVTINGFPFNSQLKLLEKHIEKVALMSPDALIVSTPAVIKLCKKVAPNIPLHLSTQANVLNYLDAEFYYDIGISRVIAAREISLNDVIEIKKHLPNLEIEVFVHGSMCFAYSGRCLISAVQSGRVPNRGSCANDCRFNYNLYAENPDNGTLFRIEESSDEGTYIMNAKDLNLSNHIHELISSNAIDSLKIEGRTKSPYYAAITAKVYREAIDDYYDGKTDTKKYEAELNTTKNRGFTDAYLVQKPFERHDTQNLTSAMSVGEWEISGLVDENGETFMCKYKTLLNEDIEILTPKNQQLDTIDNEIGSIKLIDNKYYINFKKLLTITNKELTSVHSGNLNPIKLPTKLPPFTIFRKKSEQISQ
ncbi:MAG: U32 family peptidase, partial [Campylobacterales bacterium]|nr:U32 family peptidase [Campylobacterales bacterium]